MRSKKDCSKCSSENEAHTTILKSVFQYYEFTKALNMDTVGMVLSLRILATKKDIVGELYQSFMSSYGRNPSVTLFFDEAFPRCLSA